MKAMLEQDIVSAITGSYVYDLAQPIQMGMPSHPTHPPYAFALMKRHGDAIREGGLTVCNEMMVISGHSGTHIDGLGHIACHGKLHGDRLASEHMGDKGIREVGIETVQPIICRGVMLDVARYKGVDSLSAGEAVTSEDLESCANAQGVIIEPGNAVLVRTGWIRHWNDTHTYLGMDHGTPGLDLTGAAWLAKKQVRVAGADTHGFEQLRPDHGGLPVHMSMLVDEGIHIMEMVNMEELAADKVYTFLFIVTPLKIVGATGSPVRPLAIPVGEPH